MHLVLLGEGKAVSSSSVQTDLERLEEMQRRVREITLMPGNAPDPLKVCRNEDDSDFLQMSSHDVSSAKGWMSLSIEVYRWGA